ncbi:hypothetical protein ACJJTC_008705 [Scirpophaga incertulas]
MKPFADAEIVKECFISAANILFDKYSNKKQIVSDIKKIQLSDSSCTRRIEDISKFISDDILKNLRRCKFFSLAFDASTDISATSQCSVFARYCTEKNETHQNFMTGSENGFYSLFKKKCNCSNLITFHCIIHQENLAARAVQPEIEAVMKTVINIVDYIRTKELNHRKFKTLLKELGNSHLDAIIRVACNDKPDIDKVLKKCSQFQKSH